MKKITTLICLLVLMGGSAYGEEADHRGAEGSPSRQDQRELSGERQALEKEIQQKMKDGDTAGAKAARAKLHDLNREISRDRREINHDRREMNRDSKEQRQGKSDVEPQGPPSRQGKSGRREETRDDRRENHGDRRELSRDHREQQQDRRAQK